MSEPSDETLRAAARVAGQANLIDIRCFRLEAEFTGFPDDARPLRFDLESEISYSRQENSAVVIDADYRLRIFQVPDSELPENSVEVSQSPDSDQGDQDQDVANFGFNLAAMYDLGEEAERRAFDDEELQAFTDTTAALALYPYARSTVSDLTVRLGLPNLTLPTMRVSLAAAQLAPAQGGKRRGPQRSEDTRRRRPKAGPLT